MFGYEFRNNIVLQWALGALVFVYFIVFQYWSSSSFFTKETYESAQYICPPYFQSCGELYILHALPQGYGQAILYMVFFAILAWCVYLISKKEWETVQLSLIPIFAWHSAHTLFFTHLTVGNYEYYVIAFGLILLFFPHKEFFLKLTLVIFYVLSTISKNYPSWIEGSYFSSLRTGLPLFTDWSIPVWTNVVILMEMVGAWFLMSANRTWQRAALVFFMVFHLYSGILVGYRYPATVLPFILIAFGPLYRFTKVPLDKKSLIGWGFIVLLIVLQFSPKFIPGDEKMTGEGNKYGLYMFEANHQCFSEAQITFTDGTTKDENFYTNSARNRCDPYHTWFRFNQLCMRVSGIEKIDWQFYHSVNGGAFYKIVDTKNTCDLTYKAFQHNSWIHEAEQAKKVGYPVKNLYY